MAAKRKKVGQDAVPTKEAILIEWIVMDLGNGFSKMMYSGQNEPLRWRSVQGHIGAKTRLKDLPFDWTIKWRGVFHVFGERAYMECPDTLDDFPTTDRYTSDWYKRMFAFALHKAYGLRLASKDAPFCPHIVASIPAKEYANAARLDMIKDNLYSLYEIENVPGSVIEIEVGEPNLTLIPEGAGSFLYMSSQGHSEMEKGLWAVLDLGYLTGDIVFFQDGTYVSDTSDSDSNLGMIKVSEAVADAIRGMGGPALPPAEIDLMVNQPSVIVSGDSYNVSEAYHVAMTELGERAAKFLQKKCAGKNIAGVLLTGGNVIKQSSFINPSKLPKPIICTDGEDGNVRGASLMVREG